MSVRLPDSLPHLENELLCLFEWPRQSTLHRCQLLNKLRIIYALFEGCLHLVCQHGLCFVVSKPFLGGLSSPQARQLPNHCIM